MRGNSATQDAAVEAAKEGDTSKLRQLVQHHGFQVNSKLADGIMGMETTVLHVSAFWGQTEAAIALVREFGADVNARDKWDKTALYWASMRGQLRTVSILVKGPEIELNAKNRGEQTPLDVAETNILVSCVIRTALLADANQEERLKQKLLQDLPRLTG